MVYIYRIGPRPIRAAADPGRPRKYALNGVRPAAAPPASAVDPGRPRKYALNGVRPAAAPQVKPPQMCKGPWHLCFLERPRVGPLKTPPNVKYVVHKSFKALLKVAL